MRATVSEVALGRVLAWLRWAGRDLTPDLERAALQAMADSVAEGSTDLFGACMQRLQAGGELAAADRRAPPGSQCPAASVAPPLRRGSIGYGEY
ncbi:hypothetical protein SAMN05216198_0408 [Halopseudomonas litoralis]|uniref:Uncharacterized protein n=1 Tax=Halopseudomonas litoralis TaxID=797277 RepID=A0A1H1LXQ5_9GAMM|nr:hypothetical protein [Halopseudomonas litoralis]SDR78579.1 hypothetical protein SAMN05216198_0408 [Halopseudomonas litoralis]